MKVKITFTLDIDKEVWLRTFGATAPEEFREDVRGYFEGICLSQLEQIDCGVRKDGDEMPEL